ncbi:MAG: serine hydrolase [Rikenellaceae bacterium]|nr:serine hydrolase [Rikenellaceae bacterium]
MRKLFLSAILLLGISVTQAQIYPSKEWSKAEPAKYGYDSKKLKEVYAYIQKELYTTGMMIIVGGESIFEYGSLDRVSYIASCRKSVLSMLYGKYVESGKINLDRTLEDLGIDDHGGLLPIEKKATIRHLIQARSGVYHDASNPGDDAASRPKRGSKEPGKYYLYNNWDFNVAGAIFEQLTGKNIYKALQKDIAQPIGMQDFRLENQVKSGNLNASKFPAYHIYFSTRDMARLGYLMLRGGKWGNKQVISPEWHKEMLTVWTPASEMNPDKYRNNVEYGYMWWLYYSNNPVFKGAYEARGAMGQYITVIPALDMVIAHKTDRVYQRKTPRAKYAKMVEMIVSAKTK